MLAAEGARLVIGYRSRQDRARGLEKLGRIVRADITDPAGRGALLDAAPGMYGLVVFAGDPARAATPAELEPAMRR